MRSLGAGSARTYRSLRIPNGLPYLFAALRIAVPASVVGAIVGEMVGSDQGLGFLVVRSKGTLDTELLFVAICAAAALGIVMFTIVVTIERLVIWWHPSHRASGPRRRSARVRSEVGGTERKGTLP